MRTLSAYSTVHGRRPLGALIGVSLLRTLAIVVACALAQPLVMELLHPGHAIRGELIAAAADLKDVPWGAPSERARTAVARNFRARDVSVDATRYPAFLTVTLSGLGRETCREAASAARRIEGPVLIALEGGGRCAADSNAITWRLVP